MLAVQVARGRAPGAVDGRLRSGELARAVDAVTRARPPGKEIPPVINTASTNSFDRRLPDDTHHHNVSQHLPHVAEVLTRAHVTCVQIKYDGLFDCGVVGDPVYLTSSAAQYDGCIPPALKMGLRAFFGELLELRLPGWDNAEGARGEFQ